MEVGVAVTWRGAMSSLASSGAAAASRFSFRATEETVNVLVTVATADDLVTVLELWIQHVTVGLEKGHTVHCRWRHRVLEKRRAVSGARSGGEGAGNDSSEAVIPVAG